MSLCFKNSYNDILTVSHFNDEKSKINVAHKNWKIMEIKLMNNLIRKKD